VKRGLLTRLTLSTETLARMTPRQVISRLLRRGRAQWIYPTIGRFLHPLPAPLTEFPQSIPQHTSTPWGEGAGAKARPEETLRHQVEELSAHRFAFLGLPSLHLGDPVDWKGAPDGNHLWQYELHYGQWALDLAHGARTLGDTLARATLTALLGDWITHNPVGQGTGWEPYPISRRLVAWSRLAFLFDDPDWQVFWSQRLEPSLRQQARFLAANLEHDVPNNHLLANFRALAWVALLFPHWPESRRLKRRALNGLWREMERQILSDGVHEERSISYHTIVFQDLHETWLLARQQSEPIPDTVEPTLAKMLHFLATTQAPDGSWPMVNDSVVAYPEDPAQVLTTVAASAAVAAHSSSSTPPAPPLPPATTFPEAGYAVLRDGHGGYLFFDAGPMGPPSIPGHGHADFLSFELHGGGRALVVDPGTDTYESGLRRDAQRGMAAHNTVTVDDVDPCLFWGPFRVAWPPAARLLETSDRHFVGEHEGYRRLSSPVLHRRRIELLQPGVWEILDQFETSGHHRYALTLQLAPGANLKTSECEAEAHWPDGVGLGLSWSAPAVVASHEEGSVAAGWNRSRNAPRFVLRWQTAGRCEAHLRLRVIQPL